MKTLLLLLFLLTCTTGTSSPPSSPLDLSLFPDTLTAPYGTRLFLTSHPNYLNLVWCCDIPPDADKAQFELNSGVNVWYDGEMEEQRTAVNNTQVSSRYKPRQAADASTWYLGQYNTTLILIFNQTLHYNISCNGESHPGKFEVLYKHWDKLSSSGDVWSLVSVGSLGLYNTTKLTLRKIKTLSENVKNVLWTVPGGIVTDRTVADNQTESEAENVSESDSLTRWRAWLLLVQHVTCCIPLAASPSELDLLPHTADNQLQSHFRWFMELPFVEQDEQVLWYSFNHRNLHVVSVCTYCDLCDDSAQFKWLEEDLKAASSTNETHWIMVMGHDPIYESDQSLHPEVQSINRIQLDKLFAKYDVDFAVWSHERWYERTKPMKNYKVSDERISNLLDSVNGTIHYTCGTGGIPLQDYNMEKYNHTARFLTSYYGPCAFTRIKDNQYETMFVRTDDADIVSFEDHITITKDIPQRPKFKIESHFSKFMKVFGMVIFIGVGIMLLITILVKAVQKHDPSFITNKIRNIKYRKEGTTLGGSTENLEIQEVEMDAEDIPSKNGDKVLLLDEIEDPDLQLSSAAQMYGVMM
ncbi:uncharacterized protein LOC134825117 [Bolinopsis microptera]|uniref:uncharacterized protein LOC134825117 n=1 Tax=Bolinopsis microptera TaxID=2820187 RepID=UPI003078EDCC